MIREETEEKILGALKKYGDLNITEIHKKTGVPMATVYVYLNRYLIGKVMVKKSYGTRKKAIIKVYTLVIDHSSA